MDDYKDICGFGVAGKYIRMEGHKHILGGLVNGKIYRIATELQCYDSLAVEE